MCSLVGPVCARAGAGAANEEGAGAACERLQALGPDLAAAHFLCHRNCRVRFRGHDQWTELEANGTLNIPALYVAGWYIEAIEASTANLVYEGLQNFRNLEHLKVK